MEFSILIGCSTAAENILRLENILIFYGAAAWTNQHIYYIFNSWSIQILLSILILLHKEYKKWQIAR